MNAEQIKIVRDELNQAIAGVLEKYGMTGEIGSVTYSQVGFHSTLKAQVKDIGNGKSGAQLEYEMLARKFGIDPKSFGKIFTSQGKTFQVTGINSRARTMPIMAVELSTNQQYKFPTFGKEYNFMVNAPVAPIINHNFGREE